VDTASFWRRKLRLLGLSLLPGLIACAAMPAAWPLIPILPSWRACSQDQQLLSAERKIQDDDRLHVPLRSTC
jgi:hypothetical protein